MQKHSFSCDGLNLTKYENHGLPYTWQLPQRPATVSQKLSQKKLAKIHPTEQGHKISLSLWKIVTKMKNGHIETFPHNRQELLLLTKSPLFSPSLIRSWESRWQYKNYQLHVIHIFLISYHILLQVDNFRTINNSYQITIWDDSYLHIVFLARLCSKDIDRHPSSLNIIAQRAEYDSFHKEIGQGGVQDRTREGRVG